MSIVTLIGKSAMHMAGTKLAIVKKDVNSLLSNFDLCNLR